MVLDFLRTRVAARKDNRPEREQFARQHVAAIRPRLSYLNVGMQSAADTSGLEIRLDGTLLGRASIGVPMAVDPGHHLLRATAPGKKAWELAFDVGLVAEHKQVVIPPLDGALPGAAGAKSAPARASPSPARESPFATDVGSQRRGGSTLGYALAGGGVVALGIGSYYGLRAFSRWADRNDHCPGGVCDDSAVALGDESRKAGNVSTVAMGVGVVAVGAGAFLILTSSPALSSTGSRPRLRLAGHPIGLSVAAASRTVGLSASGAW